MRLTELTCIVLIDGILLLIKLRARISTNPTNKCFLTLNHLLHLFSHRLRQVARLVQWCILGLVQLVGLIVNVHTSSTREISIANDHAL
jgi:hypothetical protein